MLTARCFVDDFAIPSIPVLSLRCGVSLLLEVMWSRSCGVPRREPLKACLCSFLSMRADQHHGEENAVVIGTTAPGQQLWDGGMASERVLAYGTSVRLACSALYMTLCRQ